LKVLIFSAFDPIPSDDAEPVRYAWLAESFLRQGHDVHYITAYFFHLQKKRRSGSGWNKDDTTPSNLQLTFLKSPSYKRNISLARLWSHFVLALNLRKYIYSLTRDELPDLIISASPPLTANYFLATFCNEKRITYILDIQDLWPEVFLKTMPKRIGTVLTFPLNRLVLNCIKSASAVASVSKDYLNHYKSALIRKDIRVFHLGIRTEFFSDPVNIKADIPIKIIYLGAAQNNKYVNHFAGVIASMEEVELTIAGRNNNEQPGLITKNVKEIPWVSFDLLPEFLKEFDIALILVEPGLKIAFPNKAFAYFAAGLPVISNIRGGELEKLIIHHDLGITIQDNNIDTLMEAIAYCRDYFNLQKRRHIREYARQNFNVLQISAQYMHWALNVAE
jgi:glycosyltransferase involved in cell wall biosynthesis